MKKTIGIIGAGNMGSAFYRGLSEISNPDALWICDHSIQKLKKITSKQFSTNSNEIIKKADVILLAIKPQSFSEWTSSLKQKVNTKLIISIMAGVSIRKIKHETGAEKIIRCMPNLPVTVQQGVIGWMATPKVTGTEKEFARKMFQSLGIEIQVKREDMIDKITALSGSGPAYFYYVCEIMSKKARQMGFTENQSRNIIEQTFFGSSQLLKMHGISAKELRQAVTSRGGTTEAAIQNFERNKLDKIIYAGIDKAFEKAQELGK